MRGLSTILMAFKLVSNYYACFDMAYAGKMLAPLQRLHGREDVEGAGIGFSIARLTAARVTARPRVRRRD